MPSDRPSSDTQGTYGQQPQPGQPYGEQQPGQPYGQPEYGLPVQGYGAPQAWQGPTQTESKAIIALVCAVAAWVVLPVLPAIAALMIGKTARQEIERSGGRLTGDGMVTAAKVIAWANIALSVLLLLLLVLGLGLFATASSGVQVR